MDIFVIVMAYAIVGMWYVSRRPKGGVRGHHLAIAYTIFLPILLVHTVIYLANRPWKKRQP